MRPLGVIVADGAGNEAALRERLVGELADHGSVAAVSRETDGRRSPPPGVDTAYRTGENGWTAAGRGESALRTILERAAPDHAYAVVTDHPSAPIPQLVVGDPEYEGEALIRAPAANEVDPQAVREALEGTEPLETLESLVAGVKESPHADRAGAIATFTGRVRERDSPDDTPTTHLEFEKYAGVADERMATIADELEARDGVFEVSLHHRTGVVEAGEDIVFVVVLAGHREEAFNTVSDGIDRLKDEVPLFKKEVTLDESFWVHQRP